VTEAEPIMTSNVPPSEPDVVNILKQPKGNLTYRILAYRPLTKAEMIKIVDEYHAREGKKPASGKTVTIMTTHGSS
jgi:hypothetical protein